MRHYAVILTDTQNIDESKYGKIYTLIEEYIKYVLPYTEDSKEKETMLEGYKKYISTIDVYSKKVYSEIKKNMLLLELSRYLFMYSLPMIAAEQCYIKLIKDARTGIVNNYIEADKFQLYQLLLDIIESYNVNILSQKVYWESSKERDEYNKFLNEFKETKKLERIDFDEYARKREVLFITNDIKMLNKSKKKYDEIKAYYRERMIIMHGFRRLKNSFKQMPGKWRTRRRKESDE